MSVAATPKPSGLKVGAEPRKVIILGALVLVAVVLYLYNSGGDTGGPGSGTTGVRSVATTTSPDIPAQARRARRRLARTGEKNALRMQVVTLEAQRGNIDPTLRLDLLKRLKSVTLSGSGRNLFSAAAAMSEMLTAKPTRIMPGKLPGPVTPQPMGPVAPSGPPPPAPIPLKFYGFAAPYDAGGARRGFFMDGDNVVVASPGDVIKGRYRIVTLEPQSAVVQDTLANNQQTLVITPEDQQSAMQ
jgi:hypothetical protein